jgi:CHAT domain-containing protein
MKDRTVIHFATHGFVVPDAQRALLMRADEQIDRELAAGLGGAPSRWRAASLLGHGILSGLALSHANRPASAKPPEDDDNLLTEAEVALLDLRATRLAVLSACETGIGDATEAQAVLGLQRAFHVAGSESVVASLWKVDDAATARLMSSFYRKAWVDGLPVPVALRAAQLEQLATPDTTALVQREPDFATAGKTVSRPAPTPSADPTRLWAAFTVSVCRDDSREPQGKP